MVNVEQLMRQAQAQAGDRLRLPQASAASAASADAPSMDFMAADNAAGQTRVKDTGTAVTLESLDGVLKQTEQMLNGFGDFAANMLEQMLGKPKSQTGKPTQ